MHRRTLHIHEGMGTLCLPGRILIVRATGNNTAVVIVLLAHSINVLLAYNFMCYIDEIPRDASWSIPSVCIMVCKQDSQNYG